MAFPHFFPRNLSTTLPAMLHRRTLAEETLFSCVCAAESKGKQVLCLSLGLGQLVLKFWAFFGRHVLIKKGYFKENEYNTTYSNNIEGNRPLFLWLFNSEGKALVVYNFARHFKSYPLDNELNHCIPYSHSLNR